MNAADNTDMHDWRARAGSPYPRLCERDLDVRIAEYNLQAVVRGPMQDPALPLDAPDDSALPLSVEALIGAGAFVLAVVGSFFAPLPWFG